MAVLTQLPHSSYPMTIGPSIPEIPIILVNRIPRSISSIGMRANIQGVIVRSHAHSSERVTNIYLSSIEYDYPTCT